jgi:hypothetical protein
MNSTIGRLRACPSARYQGSFEKRPVEEGTWMFEESIKLISRKGGKADDFSGSELL